ncbi:hypothetical protein [Capnocytophaga sp. oral taxon 878]|uniref:hypothetical protein n=1 Tax=Capnocytophaga sp. oral taxon 878 TaxID=1316596 RepID=UPI000D037F7A|nr:hypothetical protein [Capnocytophaga sp. oral taxon 878]AVM50934.1 hypothetical protein C4H12_10910 [Capnocytophaga sp. oral taxon 878]
MKRLIVSTLMLWTVMACNNTPKEIPVADDALANTEMAEAQRDKSKDANPFGDGQLSTNHTPQVQPAGVTLNPPHGQPGHRCDIAVGAPLPNDSNVIAQLQNETHPVGAGEAMPVVSNETQQIVQVQQTPSYVGAKGEKLNPPHGQPGHRCDIPVGAPLNSKPTQQTTATPAQPQVVQQQVVIDPEQAQQHTGTTEPGFSGKPNPPHGQPGHRCDIAVGATLP